MRADVSLCDEASFSPVPRRRRKSTARVALLLAYDGAGFRGFQRQPGQRTVEGEILQALTDCRLPTALSFASRTDAGVHAEGQVIVVRTPPDLDGQVLGRTLRSRLPPDVRVRLVCPTPRKFHPRWTAVGKRYRYRISAAPSPRAWSLPGLDRARFMQALSVLARAPRLCGLTAAGAPMKPAPPLDRLEWREDGDALAVTLEGPAFRRYALRHLIGAAVSCARGDRPLGSLVDLAVGAPPYRGLRAPADGLVLEQVFYPPELDPFG